MNQPILSEKTRKSSNHQAIWLNSTRKHSLFPSLPFQNSPLRFLAADLLQIFESFGNSFVLGLPPMMYPKKEMYTLEIVTTLVTPI